MTKLNLLETSLKQQNMVRLPSCYFVSVSGRPPSPIEWMYFKTSENFARNALFRRRTCSEINLQNFRLNYQTFAEKKAKNFRGLLYFAAPCIFG